MPEYRYEGIDRAGRKSRGVMNANHREAAAAALREQGLVPISIKEKVKTEPRTVPGFGSVSVQRLAEFTRKFAALAKTDIPISEVFEILAEEESGSLLPEAASHVAREVGLGRMLGEAMTDRPRAFSPLYIKMVEAGITSGTLDKVADNLASLFESENQLRKDLYSRLAYPIGLLILSFLMSIILRFIGFITPQLFAGLMGFWMVIIGLVLFGMTRTGYRIYREIGMRLPFIGTFMKKINLARFCRIFGLQYAAGVPLLEGLEASRQVLQDSNIERAVRGIEKRVQGGMELREAMVSVGVFPKQMVGMVGVGERAGGVDRMLEKLAEYYELDIRTTATIMTTVIWFVVFLMVGVTVGAIVISAWGHYFGMIGELIDEA